MLQETRALPELNTTDAADPGDPATLEPSSPAEDQSSTPNTSAYVSDFAQALFGSDEYTSDIDSQSLVKMSVKLSTTAS